MSKEKAETTTPKIIKKAKYLNAQFALLTIETQKMLELYKELEGENYGNDGI